jgi:hypothetical protein
MPEAKPPETKPADAKPKAKIPPECVELAGRALCGLLSNASLVQGHRPVDIELLVGQAAACGEALYRRLTGE